MHVHDAQRAQRALWAHSANDEGVRQFLIDHLRAVARLAGAYATPFGHADLAAAAGVLHDMGKASSAFQAYLREAEAEPDAHLSGPDHKGAGAVLACRRRLEPLALLIHGHHGGLQDRSTTQAWLRERERDPDVVALLDTLPPDLGALAEGLDASLPSRLDEFSAEFLLRMLFSCLVDADSLDTEAHFRPVLGRARENAAPALPALRDAVDEHIRQLATGAPDTQVNRLRSEVHDLCVRSARKDPGLFRLAVPTGGGKTLSGLSFALNHAEAHGLRRIVVAVPFTSITEQTARVYRRVLGGRAVLEHHSAVDRADADGGESRADLWARLAAENWDAPVVVTTTVQLFESLFASRRSATRKLHRLARSVIIVDEAQSIPPAVVEPAVQALRLLCREYGSSVVLSTATQPVADTPGLEWLQEAEDIVPEPGRFFTALARVRWSVDLEEWSADRVAERIAEAPQALAILNTRRQALAVLEHAPPGTAHLSTLLCGLHRRRVLASVAERLRRGDPCRLVSTQVVEAGVDIDFPVVLRAMAPLDSLFQAAGRCNREGRLDAGHVQVFGGDRHPKGSYRMGTDVTRELVASGERIDGLDTISAYFLRFYRLSDTDRYGVRRLQRGFAYRQVSEAFRMIREDQTSVAIRFDTKADALLLRLRQVTGRDLGEARRLLRGLQPYLVALRPRELDRADRRGWISHDGPLPVWTGPYDPVRGVGALLAAGGDDGCDEPATA